MCVFRARESAQGIHFAGRRMQRWYCCQIPTCYRQKKGSLSTRSITCTANSIEVHCPLVTQELIPPSKKHIEWIPVPSVRDGLSISDGEINGNEYTSTVPLNLTNANVLLLEER